MPRQKGKTNLFKTKTRIHPFIIIFIVSLISIGFTILCSFILDFFKIEDIGGYKFQNLTQEFFISVLIGPIFETFVFQYSVYYLVRYLLGLIQNQKSLKYFNEIYVVISGLLFAVSHSYSAYYILIMIVPGFLLAYFYVFSLDQYNRAFLYTFLIHLLHNFYIMIIEYYNIL